MTFIKDNTTLVGIEMKKPATGNEIDFFENSCSWAIGNFFGETQIINYVKAFFAYMLGMITFIFLATALGVLIDIIKGY